MKATYLGLNYIVRRSTFSDANKRRDSSFFAAIYAHLYHKYAKVLSDSRPNNERKLYIMDSTTITLFKQILKGAGLIAENDMPDNTDDATLIDEVVEFAFGEKKA